MRKRERGKEGQMRKGGGEEGKRFARKEKLGNGGGKERERKGEGGRERCEEGRKIEKEGKRRKKR